MTQKILYTAHASATGGRNGHARTDDDSLALTLASPKELGGTGAGNNPEQLFAAGYAARAKTRALASASNWWSACPASNAPPPKP